MTDTAFFGFFIFVMLRPYIVDFSLIPLAAGLLGFRLFNMFFLRRSVTIGLFAGAPLIILSLIQVILDLCGSDSAAMSGAIGFTYGAFFLPLRCIDNTISVYWSLYAAVVIVLLTHIAYTCGGLKVKRQNEKIKRTNRMIYGDHPGAKSVIGQKPIEEIVQENAKHDNRRRKKRERRKK